MSARSAVYTETERVLHHLAQLQPANVAGVDVRMRDMCFAAAKQGMALDYSWAPELTGRTCEIPPARRRNTWRGRFARQKFVSD